MSNNWTDLSATLVQEGGSGEEDIDPAIMEGKKEDDEEGSSYYSAEGEESEWEEEEAEME